MLGVSTNRDKHVRILLTLPVALDEHVVTTRGGAVPLIAVDKIVPSIGGGYRPPRQPCTKNIILNSS